MPSVSNLLAFAATAAATTYSGFNYASTHNDGSAMTQADFESYFKTQANLVGTSGFTSARLYTMIQGLSTTGAYIEAIPAAINTKTSLLMTLWASAGDSEFATELAALKAAISDHGSDLGPLCAGISIGSEDLYRNSPTGIAAGSYVGANPDTLVSYIKQVRTAISGTALSGCPVGHVDTWTAWVNGSNQEVIDNCDWLGVDAYPYFQNTMSNAIGSGKSLFYDAMDQTTAVAGGKAVWVTETGWPVSGKTENLAIPSTDNAKAYWDDVGCSLFGNTNTWWYTLQDADATTTPNPSFGIVGTTLSTTPLFNLTCPPQTSSSASPSATGSTTAAPSSTSSSNSSGTHGTLTTSSKTGSATASGSSPSSSTHSSGAITNVASMGFAFSALVFALAL